MQKSILNQGFTLIEVMVVVVILSILAALVVPRIMDNPDKARLLKVEQDIRAISTALKLYKLDNYSYPITDQGLEALIIKTTVPPEPRQWKSGGYLDSLATDPWGFPYNYLSPGIHGEYDLYSQGADGQADGTDINADIGNWQLK
ncbi:MAG: type II secretion system protein GspG [Gammaproteobacteria bacterium]|nr:MAG: type II secretion system protein GspG [Gammaproteobacteria bacterium]